MKMADVVCERCGATDRHPSDATWPASCSRCAGKLAPRWWFRENNPDQKSKGRA